jgi:hypothetical protein
MGEVYLAEHTLLRRPCAVKLIRAGVGEEKQIARFEREVQATAGLTHPNTVEIYDYGRAEDAFMMYVANPTKDRELGQTIGFLEKCNLVDQKPRTTGDVLPVRPGAAAKRKSGERRPSPPRSKGSLTARRKSSGL